MTIEQDINGLSYEVMEALINQPEIQKKFQKLLDLTTKQKGGLNSSQP